MVNVPDLSDKYTLLSGKKISTKNVFSGKFCTSCVKYTFIFAFPALAVILLGLSNWFLLDQGFWLTCLRRFDYLDVYEENFGNFISTYYLDRCYDWRAPLPPQRSLRKTDLPSPPVPDNNVCSKVADKLKFECFPRGNVSEQACNARGCCFIVSPEPLVPACFYPPNFTSYHHEVINHTDSGITAVSTALFKSPYPNDAVKLYYKFTYISENTLLVMILDSEVPKRDPFLDNFSPIPHDPSYRQYRVEMNLNQTGFKIIRSSNNQSILDTNVGGLIYSEQLMQISTTVPSDRVYGIGERRGPLLVPTEWNTVIPIFAHDSPPTDKVNGYGTFPFYLCIEDEGLSHGVTFLNLYGMDVVVQPGPSITYRAIGGGLGFLVTVASNPLTVVQEQSAHNSPRTPLPPYWALGFHLSRFGYKTLEDMKEVLNRTQMAGIPVDTQWADLDYMNNHNDFTVDPVRYKGLKQFVNDLHSRGMHFVPLLDPGLSGGEKPGSYPPYDEALAQGVLVMDASGNAPYLGKVWNSKSTAFVDFTHPRAIQYWTDQLSAFHQLLPFDGLWIDMNEPSNFLNGTECGGGPLEEPPYMPQIEGPRLSYKTVCMSAQHFRSYQYHVHNSYGPLEAVATSFGLAEVRGGLRPFVISRSTSLWTSRFGGHWTGDVYSSWDDLKQSVRDIISSSMFGQSLVGADICGFNGNTTAALCSRWSQLGAFYPFSRNHNSDDNIAQDPVALGDQVVESAKKSLLTRYSLLPYLYTLFWHRTTHNLPVVQPLFFQFPKDNNTYKIDDMFMWGPALLVAPVVEDGVTFRKVYLSQGVWYDWRSGERTDSPGKDYAASAPASIIPLFLRGGYVIPLQQPNTTTTFSRQNPFHLRIGLDEKKTAEGSLYWDSGDSFAPQYNHMTFNVVNDTLTSNVTFWTYETGMILNQIRLGYVESIKSVFLNDTLPCIFNMSIAHKEVKIINLNINMKYPFKIHWN